MRCLLENIVSLSFEDYLKTLGSKCDDSLTDLKDSEQVVLTIDEQNKARNK